MQTQLNHPTAAIAMVGSVLVSLQLRGTSAWIGSNKLLSLKTPRICSRTLVKSPSPFQQQIQSQLCSTLIDEATGEDVSDDKTSSDFLRGLIPGSNDGFFVVKTYPTDPSGFDVQRVGDLVDPSDVERLEVSPQNISVPLALMLLDPDEHPSQSQARKACRKATIMIHRGPLEKDEYGQESIFVSEKCIRARVGDRVYPGDVLAKQVRMGSGNFPVMNHKKPPFELPVIFEDDHFAIVNKPAGVVVYAQRKGGHGVMTVRAALPFAVQPPKPGTFSTLRRPQPVHRLDKPTSGLLVIAKTKPAMIHLSHQFRERRIKKTYTAIVNGIPEETPQTAITSREAYQLGVDVEATGNETWHMIDYPLDDKSAVTVWRALSYSKSLKAIDNYVTLVELKLKTGRYHQLRRHMSWVLDSPIIGDNVYDGGGMAMQLRERGLFLCSNRVVLEHPYYNDLEESSRETFARLTPEEKESLWLSDDGKIMVTACIDLPEKFVSFIRHEEERYQKLVNQ